MSLKLSVLPPNTIASGGVLRQIEAIRRHTVHDVVDSPATADVVHVHAGWPSLRRDIYTCHGLNLITPSTNAYYVRENEIVYQHLRQATIRITVSQYFASVLRAKGFHVDYVIPNGIEFNYRITPVYEPFVLYLGRNDPIKRPSDVIDIARMMPETQFVATLPPARDHPTNLLCLGERIPHERVLELLRRCRVHLMTSEFETFGISILEAWNARKPTVAPLYSGHPAEMIHHQIDGVLYHRHADAVAAITDAWDHAELYGDAGYEHAEHYQWGTIISALDQIYSLLGGSK